jgi:YidC/Oxa1 family membrane protein insertase
MQQHQPPQDVKNLTLAFVFCCVIIALWQYFVIQPEQQKLKAAEAAKLAEQQLNKPVVTSQPPAGDAAGAIQTSAAVAESPRLRFNNDKITGSIALRGLRIDDLTLDKYKVSLDSQEKVKLLLPADNALPYFLEFGWLSAGDGLKTPDQNSLWQADQERLAPGSPVTLSWKNEDGVTFRAIIEIDENYLFKITKSVENRSGKLVSLYPYGLISKSSPEHSVMPLLHEGPLGTINKVLEEIAYSDLKEDGPQKHSNVSGWFGVTDKYWLSAIIPPVGKNYEVSMKFVPGFENDRYQVDYMGGKLDIADGASASEEVRLFLGAKELKLLDKYSENFGIPLFDRAVDLGYLYFLTKPIFEVLSYFYHWLGNFGLAILLLTVCFKALMFPLAYKSYRAINELKELQPDIERIRQVAGDDKMRLNKELMDLYKKKKVNPAAGCLPLLIQMPIFFALYKVLYVTIEMRHAPFYGWIRDLSSLDPTNLFTLFGVINWMPPSFLHVGAWPIIMLITMLVQQRLQPTPTDPTQATVIKLMPWIFIVMFASFPAGLIIYWAWSNTISIVQQLAIAKIHKKQVKKHGTAKPARNKSTVKQ